MGRSFGGVMVNGFELCWRWNKDRKEVEVILPGRRVHTVPELWAKGYTVTDIPTPSFARQADDGA